MTQNDRGKALLHTLIRKGFAALMITGSFMMAGQPWTHGAGFGPPAWIAERFIRPHHADCALPQAPATASRATASAESQRRVDGWWL